MKVQIVAEIEVDDLEIAKNLADDFKNDVRVADGVTGVYDVFVKDEKNRVCV